MDNTTIVFTDIKFKELGRVTVKDGKLEGDTAFAKDFVYDAQTSHTSPEDFVKKFSKWSNGYFYSEIEA